MPSHGLLDLRDGGPVELKFPRVSPWYQPEEGGACPLGRDFYLLLTTCRTHRVQTLNQRWAGPWCERPRLSGAAWLCIVFTSISSRTSCQDPKDRLRFVCKPLLVPLKGGHTNSAFLFIGSCLFDWPTGDRWPSLVC